MSIIKIENLTFSYYGYVKPVFENVSFSFDTNWKTGLIGRNGIGKSTLFKLLLNQEVYQGKISKSVDFIKFPPNLSDTSKLGIELYKELISDEESREGTLEWVPYDEVLSKPTWEGDYEIFKWILEDRPFFSAKFSYDRNQNLVDKTVTFYDK